MKKDSKKTKSVARPKPEDYFLPRSQVELGKLLSRMNECGIQDGRAMEILRERKEKFDKAITEYKTNVNEQQD